MDDPRIAGARALVIVAVGGFLGALAWHLPKPGYTHLRLAFFLVLAGLAVCGAAGVLRHDLRLVALGVAGLSLLGLWQATLWIFVLPVAGVIALGALVVDRGSSGNGQSA